MKIRTGFVSNSSSSSFVLFGVNAHSSVGEKILDMVKKKVKQKKNEEYYEYEERVTAKLEEIIGTDLSLVRDLEREAMWVGRNPCEMSDDMTMKQFKQSVVDKLSKVSQMDAETVQSSCEFFVEESNY